MTKLEFLTSLNEKLSGLPGDDIQERLRFYSEIIEDRMEEGLSEEEAVLAVGTVDEIAAQILDDFPLFKREPKNIEPKKRMRTWEILLLILGSPVWLCLLIAASAVVLSLYVSLWAVIISLWAVFGSLIGCTLGGIIAGIGFMFLGNNPAGIAVVGASTVCAGLVIFLFYGCKAATKGTFLLTKKFALWIPYCFVKRRERNG